MLNTATPIRSIPARDVLAVHALPESAPPVIRLHSVTPSRRSPPTSAYPHMSLMTTHDFYAFSVQLSREITPEMVTIFTKKNHRIGIIADVWHSEVDAHFEWTIDFAPYDVDENAIHVYIENGLLSITARRG